MTASSNSSDAVVQVDFFKVSESCVMQIELHILPVYSQDTATFNTTWYNNTHRQEMLHLMQDVIRQKADSAVSSRKNPASVSSVSKSSKPAYTIVKGETIKVSYYFKKRPVYQSCLIPSNHQHDTTGLNYKGFRIFREKLVVYMCHISFKEYWPFKEKKAMDISNYFSENGVRKMGNPSGKPDEIGVPNPYTASLEHHSKQTSFPEPQDKQTALKKIVKKSGPKISKLERNKRKERKDFHHSESKRAKVEVLPECGSVENSDEIPDIITGEETERSDSLGSEDMDTYMKLAHTKDILLDLSNSSEREPSSVLKSQLTTQNCGMVKDSHVISDEPENKPDACENQNVCDRDVDTSVSVNISPSRKSEVKLNSDKLDNCNWSASNMVSPQTVTSEEVNVKFKRSKACKEEQLDRIKSMFMSDSDCEFDASCTGSSDNKTASQVKSPSRVYRMKLSSKNRHRQLGHKQCDTSSLCDESESKIVCRKTKVHDVNCESAMKCIGSFISEETKSTPDSPVFNTSQKSRTKMKSPKMLFGANVSDENQNVRTQGQKTKSPHCEKSEKLKLRTSSDFSVGSPDTVKKVSTLGALEKCRRRSQAKLKNLLSPEIEDPDDPIILDDVIINEALSTSPAQLVNSSSTHDFEKEMSSLMEVKYASVPQMKSVVSCFESELRDIFQGKVLNQRHEDYRQGGTQRKKLDFQVHLGLFTEDQTDAVMEALMDMFCKNHHKYLDYVLKVLLPEVLIRAYMLVHRTSYETADREMIDACAIPGAIIK